MVASSVPSGDERASRTDQLGARAIDLKRSGGHSATDAKTVRIWPAIATPEMLCDKLTANMSHKQWREWISADIEYVEFSQGYRFRATTAKPRSVD